RYKRIALFGLVALILVVAVGSIVYFSSFAKRIEEIHSVAVIPVGQDRDAAYFSEELCISIIDNLSRLPNLRVTSLNSALRYEGKQTDPQSAGRGLNVQAVLMVRPTLRGDDVSVNVELVDAGDNRYLWGRKYDGKRTDILGIPEGILRDMAEKLRPKLTGEERKHLVKRYTENSEAFQAFLRGRSYLEQRNQAAIKQAIDYFEQAIKIDPNYAPAYDGIAHAYYTLREDFLAFPEETRQKIESALSKALQLDNNLAEAHALLGAIKQDQ